MSLSCRTNYSTVIISDKTPILTGISTFYFVKRIYNFPKSYVEMTAFILPRLEMPGISCGPVQQIGWDSFQTEWWIKRRGERGREQEEGRDGEWKREEERYEHHKKRDTGRKWRLRVREEEKKWDGQYRITQQTAKLRSVAMNTSGGTFNTELKLAEMALLLL